MLSSITAKKARDTAQYHLQLRVCEVKVPENYDGGPCEVTAEVARCFRDGGDMAQGQLVSLQVFCFVPPDGSPTGPTWLDYSLLKPGAVLEAFANRAPDGRVEVAMFQVAFAPGVSDVAASGLWNEPEVDEVRWLQRVARAVGRLF